MLMITKKIGSSKEMLSFHRGKENNEFYLMNIWLSAYRYSFLNILSFKKKSTGGNKKIYKTQSLFVIFLYVYVF